MYYHTLQSTTLIRLSQACIVSSLQAVFIQSLDSKSVCSSSNKTCPFIITGISNYADSILLPSFFLSQALIMTLKHLLPFVLQEFLKARCWGLLLFLWWSILLFLSQLLTKTELFKLFENLSTMELWLEVVFSLFFFFNSYIHTSCFSPYGGCKTEVYLILSRNTKTEFISLDISSLKCILQSQWQNLYYREQLSSTVRIFF